MMCSHVPFKASRDGLAALEIAKQQFPDLKVVLFGSSYRPLWVPGWMTYKSDPPQNEIVDRFYNGSSIMVSPSLTEGFGLPAVEAACCGCALVATDTDGHREYVTHGDTGLLSPPQDPRALASNICALLADDALRIRLARAANTFVKQYSWQRSADLMESFLLETAQRKPLACELKSALQASPA
jgi:glycosyltransferase involved in cell wall biosynthesis